MFILLLVQLQVIWDEPLNEGGLPYNYSIEVADADGGIAYQGSQSGRYVDIQNLAMNMPYTVIIYAFNDVDTNYVLYSAQATTIPSPIEIEKVCT